MKPDWDKLMKEFDGHKTILIADVDCDGTGKDLCETHGIEGFPTLKHGSPDALEDYEGERDFDTLKKFASELKPSCSPSNIDACEEPDKSKVQALLEKSKEELEKQVNDVVAKIKDANKVFEAEVELLQKKYDELEKTKSAAVTAAQDGADFRNLKKVFVFKGGKVPDMGGGPEGGEDMGEEGEDMGDMPEGEEEVGEDEDGGDDGKKEL
jgi:hypothetical protein